MARVADPRQRGEKFNCIVENVRTGTNGKYVIMGRSMGPVRKVAEDLKALVGNDNVFILDDAYLNGMKFKLDDYEFILSTGKKISIQEGYPLYNYKGDIIGTLAKNEEWTVEMAYNDMRWNPSYKGIKDDNGMINNISDLKNLPMFKINNNFITIMKSNGSEILNIGNPTNELAKSLFFDMEKDVMGFH